MNPTLVKRLRAHEERRSVVVGKVRGALARLFPLGTIVEVRLYGEANRKARGEVTAWAGTTSEVTVKLFEPFRMTRGKRVVRKVDVHWERVEKWPASTDDL